MRPNQLRRMGRGRREGRGGRLARDGWPGGGGSLGRPACWMFQHQLVMAIDPAAGRALMGPPPVLPGDQTAIGEGAFARIGRLVGAVIVEVARAPCVAHRLDGRRGFSKPRRGGRLRRTAPGAKGENGGQSRRAGRPADQRLTHFTSLRATPAA